MSFWSNPWKATKAAVSTVASIAVAPITLLGDGISAIRREGGKLINSMRGLDDGGIEVGKTIDQAISEAQPFLNDQQRSVAGSNDLLRNSQSQHQSLLNQEQKSKEELASLKNQVGSLTSELGSVQSLVSSESSKQRDLSGELTSVSEEGRRQQALLEATLHQQAEREKDLVAIKEDINSDKNQQEYLAEELAKIAEKTQKLTDSERLFQTAQDLIDNMEEIDSHYGHKIKASLAEEELDILGSIIANIEHQ